MLDWFSLAFQWATTPERKNCYGESKEFSCCAGKGKEMEHGGNKKTEVKRSHQGWAIQTAFVLVKNIITDGVFQYEEMMNSTAKR